MSREDCYYFLYSSCRNGASCEFRHSEPAKLQVPPVICTHWQLGRVCPLGDSCPDRHSIHHLEKRNTPCYWESNGGCTKPNCPFMHTLPKGETVAAQTKESPKVAVSLNPDASPWMQMTIPPATSAPAVQQQSQRKRPLPLSTAGTAAKVEQDGITVEKQAPKVAVVQSTTLKRPTRLDSKIEAIRATKSVPTAASAAIVVPKENEKAVIGVKKNAEEKEKSSDFRVKTFEEIMAEKRAKQVNKSVEEVKEPKKQKTEPEPVKITPAVVSSPTFHELDIAVTGLPPDDEDDDLLKQLDAVLE